jgi:hypothetical protein
MAEREMHSGLMWENVKEREGLNKFRRRWEYNIKMSLKNWMAGRGLDSCPLRKVTIGGLLQAR